MAPGWSASSLELARAQRAQVEAPRTGLEQAGVEEAAGVSEVAAGANWLVKEADLPQEEVVEHQNAALVA